MLQPVGILTVGAHPDDIELGCGGTVSKLVRLGRRVGAVDLSRGELGSRGDPETRSREAAAASDILGLTFRVNLRMRDGSLSVDEASRLELVRVIRACRPDLVLTHSAHGHPDHWVAHRLVREAVHHAGLSRIETGQGRFRPGLLAFWLEYTQAAIPDVVVDISDDYDSKEKALRAFHSQLHDPQTEDPETYLSRPQFLDQVKSHHRHLGNLSGCDLGEGFLLSRLPRISDLSAI